jgi:FMN-dependent NADH-azoreductase
VKKLLYISIDLEPEELSTSKTIGREFINRFLSNNPDYQQEELDLYKAEIPEIYLGLLAGRAELVSGVEYDGLAGQDKKAVDRINALCNQFTSADIYVIASLMTNRWDISYPSMIKSYLDCIVLNNKSIKFSSDKVTRILNDKIRGMAYIQSSIGFWQMFIARYSNPEIDYCNDFFKFLGINKFEKMLVQGIDMHSVDKDAVIRKFNKDIDNIIHKLS